MSEIPRADLPSGLWTVITIPADCRWPISPPRQAWTCTPADIAALFSEDDEQ